MVNAVAAARTGVAVPVGLLPAADRATKAVVVKAEWRTRGCQLRVCLRTALEAGFLAACGGLLVVIALRGYTIYG
jgi:hypothetical protein